jgi:transposase
MRAANTLTKSLFTMRRLNDFVPDNRPLRSVRKMVNQALKNIEPLLFGMYAGDIKGGHPSIAPEKLLRAMLLQIFYTIRCKRMLMQHTTPCSADS